MSLWDNVRSRFGRGDRYDVYQDEDRYASEGLPGAYEEGDYEEYDDGSGNDYGYTNGYDDHPARMRTFGVDRADYYNDNHAPLVSMADVRSQPLPSVTATGQPADRIPAPRVYRRGTNRIPNLTPELDEDALAFKGGLARTTGSFAQLQTERLRMENSGRIPRVHADGARQSERIVDPTFFDPAATAANITPGQVRQRVHRRLEHIRPATYADAEQVATELRKGVVVVVDLRNTRPELAKRILDFSFGVVSAFEGMVDRHIDRVYIFTRNGSLTDDERAAIRV